MNHCDLRSLRERINRDFKTLKSHTGENWTGSHSFENGEVHHYHFHGIKSLCRFKDDLFATFVFVWAMKDYLKKEANLRGKDPNEIEQIANRSKALKLVSDVANGIKHGSLLNSRSGHSATIAVLRVSIPQEAISSISFGAFDITTKIEKPELTEFKAEVVGVDGSVFGSALHVLQDAMESWERDAWPYLGIPQPSAKPDSPP